MLLPKKNGAAEETVITARGGVRYKMDARMTQYRDAIDHLCDTGEMQDTLTNAPDEVQRAIGLLMRLLRRWHAFKDTKPARPGFLEAAVHRQCVEDIISDIEPARLSVLLTVINANGWQDELKVNS